MTNLKFLYEFKEYNSIHKISINESVKFNNSVKTFIMSNDELLKEVKVDEYI